MDPTTDANPNGVQITNNINEYEYKPTIFSDFFRNSQNMMNMFVGLRLTYENLRLAVIYTSKFENRFRKLMYTHAKF